MLVGGGHIVYYCTFGFLRAVMCVFGVLSLVTRVVHSTDDIDFD